MAKMRSNMEIWNAMRVEYPSFGQITSKATEETFTEKGWTAMKNLDGTAISEFFKLLIRVTFNRLDLADSKDYFDEIGYGESFENPYGGVIQRVAINMLKPISPKYKGLTDGSSVDPYVVRKPSTSERFFNQNFDYQNLVSIQEYEMKTIFLDQYGFDAFSSGLMAASLAGYAEQKYLAKLECVNEILNSTEYPLQDTQKITATFADDENPTADELKNQFIIPIQTLLDSANAMSSTSGFNSYKFRSRFDKSNMVMLVRAGFMEAVEANVNAYAFKDDYLKLPIEYHIVNDFGGLQPYKESTYTTPLYPVYDSLGAMIGYNEQEGQSNVTVKENEAFFKDPNKDVIALISDKRSIFHAVQNPITIIPHLNGAGLYTNYWQSSPNNAIKYDPIYNNIAVYKSTGE